MNSTTMHPLADSPATPRLIAALLVGQARRQEFAGAAAWLGTHTNLSQAADVTEAEAILRLSAGPHWIVLTQSYPGEYFSAQLDRLRRAAPLARLLLLLGSWCDGEGCRPELLRGTVRIPWHQQPVRLPCELQRTLAGQSRGLGLPLTSTIDERLEHLAHEPLTGGSGLVVIAAAQQDTAQSLAEMLDRGALGSVWLPPDRELEVSGAAAVVWDVPSCPQAAARDARRFRRQLSGVPVLALVQFARPQDYAELQPAGVQAILSKPVLLGDLLWQVQTLIAKQQPATASCPPNQRRIVHPKAA